MLDEYVFGTATRISPEAPVMVIRHRETQSVPGGAANVALNIQAMGGTAFLIGLAGADDGSDQLKRGLVQNGLNPDHVLTDPSRPTTRKTRVVANAAHQVLRIDYEETRECTDDMAEQICRHAAAVLQSGVDVILASDYQKGALTEAVLAEVIQLARTTGVPFVANAKPKTAHRYRQATLVSLNRPETEELVEAAVQKDHAMQWAGIVRDRIGSDHALVTLGGDGMATESFQIPAVPVQVYDPAGAGDTAIATIALGLGAVGFEASVFELASRTAAAVIQRIGVAVPSSDDLQVIAGTE